MWLIMAILSAVFAALTAILSLCGQAGNGGGICGISGGSKRTSEAAAVHQPAERGRPCAGCQRCDFVPAHVFSHSVQAADRQPWYRYFSCSRSSVLPHCCHWSLPQCFFPLPSHPALWPKSESSVPVYPVQIPSKSYPLQFSACRCHRQSAPAFSLLFVIFASFLFAHFF